LVLFLATVCGLGLFWRAGVFINDTYTIVRALEAVSSGTLQVDVVDGNHFAAPGAVISDGAVYGRNYGQVFLALPLLWVLEALSAVADLRVGLVALWHLGALWLVAELGRLVDRRRWARYASSVLVLGSFLLNVWLATRFSAPSLPLLALQLLGLLAAGTVAVLTYKLVRIRGEQRIAILAGGASALVLPVGFWAQLPKRHVLVTAILLGILYAFTRSRSADARREVPILGPVPVYRAGAYALVGLLAWIHAAEGLFVFIALVAVDVPTAPSNDARTLAVLVGVLGLSFVPLLSTNLVVAGDVLQPPRTLPPADQVSSTSADVLRGGVGGGAGGGGGLSGLPGGAMLAKLVWVATLVLSQVSASLERFGDAPAVLHTWIRSGSLEGIAERGVPRFRAVNLAVLEAAPLLAGLVVVIRSVFGSSVGELRRRVTPTDLLATSLVLAYVLLFMQSLPVHVQVTVRYLLPIYPLGLYLLVRQRFIGRLVTDRLRPVAWSYAAVTLLGTQLILAAVLTADMTVSEAAQLHAMLALVAAGVLVVAVFASWITPRARTPDAAALGVAAGLGTAFVLLTGFAYFAFVGEFVLPVSEAVADLIGRV
jgi:hypothetical protein